MSLGFHLYLALSSAIFVAAASMSKQYATTDKLAWFLVALCLYGIGNFLMIRVMREGGLGMAFAVSSVAQLILVNLIAWAFFGERLTGLQYAGLALGLVSIALIMFPASGRAG